MDDRIKNERTPPSKEEKNLTDEIFAGHPDGTKEEYFIHTKNLIRFRFEKLLQIERAVLPHRISGTEDSLPPVPAEAEITNLLSNDYKALYLQNILYHLRRAGKRIPGILFPQILTEFKSEPGQWTAIYQHSPDLTLQLAQSCSDWEYMLAAFDPEEEPVVGKPFFYETLIHRIRQYPESTSRFIREAYSTVSAYHKPRLISVLEYDTHPENRDFLLQILPDAPKAVRLSILEIGLKQKFPEIYNLILASAEQPVSDIKKFPKPWYPGLWMDLSSLVRESDPLRLPFLLADPEDLPLPSKKAPRDLSDDQLPVLLRYKDQKRLYDYFLRYPSTPFRHEILKSLSNTLLVHLLEVLYPDSKSTEVDSAFFDILAGIRPFPNEEISTKINQKILLNWKENPYNFPEYPLEIWGIRIHPNQIQNILQHPLLQTTEEKVVVFRELLKSRLSFMKKCYK